MRWAGLLAAACAGLLAAACAGLWSGPAQAGDSAPEAAIRPAFARCRALTAEAERLACYDRLATLLGPPRFQGRLTAQTEPFAASAGTVLRYESDGPIFVMSLKDAQGDTVQNLHIGGGGSASHVIATPGTYALQISGSESWRIWIDPPP